MAENGGVGQVKVMSNCMYHEHLFVSPLPVEMD